MSRQPAVVTALLLLTAALATPAAAQSVNFGNVELGEIRTDCIRVCFASSPSSTLCDAPGTIQPITTSPPFFVRGVRVGASDADLCNNPQNADPAQFPVQIGPGEALIFDLDLVAVQTGFVLRDVVHGGSEVLFPAQAMVLPAPPCPPSDPDSLCLNDDRFRVRVNWRTRQGPRGHASVVQGVQSDDSGLFYFFNPNNWEMLVKMVDACDPPFDRFWVFYAATTNVEFNVTVTDTEHDVVKSYFNPLGNAAAPIQDTNAFATCP